MMHTDVQGSKEKPSIDEMEGFGRVKAQRAAAPAPWFARSRTPLYQPLE